MRDFTPETLNKLKPSWATHYRVNIGEILFESKNQWMAIGFNFPFIKRGPFKQKSKLTKCKPIPEFKAKPFDITKYKFSEEDVECELAAGNNLLLINNTGYNCIPFSKSDAIAIAKALGVTGEDLK